MALDPNALPKPKKRSSWRIASPLIFFLVVAAAWSGFWVFVSRETEAGLDIALAHEAANGRTLACAERTFSGFPFRIEVSCRALTIDVDRGDERWSLSAARLVAVAQVYQPRHIILEVTGPINVVSPDDPREIEARFTELRASFVSGNEGPDRVAVVVGGLDADVILGEARQKLIGQASGEFHARRSAAADAAPGSYDVALSLDAASVPEVDSKLGPAPAKVSFVGVIKGLTDWSPRPFQDRLRDWQAAGGSLVIERAQIDRGETSAKASGEVALDPEGRPDGKVFVTLAGVDVLTQQLKDAAIAPPNVTRMLGVGLAILGKPSNIDGKAAVELPLTMKEGRASLGAFPMARLNPLF